MSSTRLISSLEIVHRVDDAALAYTLARMKVLERIPGNPVGIACRKLDDATALMARNLPSSSFNSVVGMRKGQAGHVRQLVEWYRRVECLEIRQSGCSSSVAANRSQR